VVGMAQWFARHLSREQMRGWLAHLDSLVTSSPAAVRTSVGRPGRWGHRPIAMSVATLHCMGWWDHLTSSQGMGTLLGGIFVVIAGLLAFAKEIQQWRAS
jgi:hypothetical protein